jgi:hypothetical protein
MTLNIKFLKIKIQMKKKNKKKKERRRPKAKDPQLAVGALFKFFLSFFFCVTIFIYKHRYFTHF